MATPLRRTPAAPPRPVRVAVVGLGYWGPNLVRNLHDLPEGEVAVLCDRRSEALDAVGRRYPGVARTRVYSDVLADPTVEAVAIATPVSTHYELAAAALRAGKHVFVEKPMAASSSDALELMDLASQADLVLMPGHTFLYSPSVNLIRDLIRSGELGDIYFVSASRVNLGLHQTDVSVTWDLGAHDFSILNYWLGEMPTSVAAFSRGCIMPGIPDVAFINLRYSEGTIAHVEISWLAPSKLRRTAVVGSQKMVVYDDTSNEPVRIYDAGVMPRNPETFAEYQLSYRAGDVVSPRVDAVEPLSLQLRDFCLAVREGVEPRSNGARGVAVVAVCEAVDRSLARNGAPVATTRPELPVPALAAQRG